MYVYTSNSMYVHLKTCMYITQDVYVHPTRCMSTPLVASAYMIRTYSLLHLECRFCNLKTQSIVEFSLHLECHCHVPLETDQLD